MAGSDSTLSTFTAADGDNLAVQRWPVPPGVARRGAVVLVHGLGEHAGRYERLAQHLVAWGFEVHGYDQCGHGESGGTRGCVPGTQRLMEDLYDVIDSVRRRLPAGAPLLVLGHSMGGLVASCLVLQRDVPVDGVVLSSPAFEAELSTVQRWLLAVLPRLAPNLTVRNKIPPQALSHDPDVVQAYQDDPLVHDRVSGRLAKFIAEAGPRVLARAGRWNLPTLLLYGGSDCIVNPRGSRRFAAAAPAGLVTSHCFDSMFHEVFNEQEAEPVYRALRGWLDRQFPPRQAAPRASAPPAPAPRHAGAAPATPVPPRRLPPEPASPSSAAPSPGS